MDFKHAIINKVQTILVETVSAKTQVKNEAFRHFLEKKFPEANGDFLLLYRDIENDYYYIETDEKLDPKAGFGNLSKLPWQADSYRPEKL